MSSITGPSVVHCLAGRLDQVFEEQRLALRLPARRRKSAGSEPDPGRDEDPGGAS